MDVPFLHIMSLLLHREIIFPGISMANTAIPANEISIPDFIFSSGMKICAADSTQSKTARAKSASPAQ